MAKKKKVAKVEEVEEVEESKAGVKGPVIPKFRGVPIDEIMDSGDEELIVAYKEDYSI